MACGDYAADPLQYFLEFRWIDGAVCYYGDEMGVLVFMLLFFGATFVSLYQASGSAMLPIAVLLALAPLVVVLLPALGVQFIAVVVVILIPIGAYWMFLRLG